MTVPPGVQQALDAGGPTRPVAEARRIVRDATRLRRRLETARRVLEGSADAVRYHHAALAAQQAERRLAELPLTSLRSATATRLPLAPLARAGYQNVAQLSRTSAAQLERLQGIGPASSRVILAAVEQLRQAAAEQARFRIELDPSNPVATALLQALQMHGRLRAASAGLEEDHAELATPLATGLRAAAPAGNRLRWWLTGRARRDRARDGVESLVELLADADGLLARCDAVGTTARQQYGDPWPEFEANAADYYARLSQLVPTTSPLQAGFGYLTDEVIARVEAQSLDRTELRLTLRAYQEFGAKFALAQRRVILGDEMGLGKTIQALAGLAHTRRYDPRPLLVVAPASVLTNWTREITTKTTLDAVALHGPDRQDEVSEWLAGNAVAVTTFETLRRLELPSDLSLAALVVDEAHYVKNPRTARAEAVRRLLPRAENVWFLTGTPMENTVEEFGTLIGYLQPGLLGPDGAAAEVGSVAFRRRVAPVYLRRNAEDVLAELPPRQEINEWLPLSRADRAMYRQAVVDGNFMAMRRAGLSSADPRSCAKTERLVELVEEAAANGRKTVIYSFFREVIGIVGQAVPLPVFGPITGVVAAADRQRIVDAFTGHPGPAVLLSQIQAGGVGLNVQAASVVIICEPQLTPTSEDQAIARAHRMGQVRTVEVYRLLNPDTIDARLAGLLADKRSGFDQYARRSELAEATVAAVDLSIGGLAQHLVQQEQARLNDLR